MGQVSAQYQRPTLPQSDMPYTLYGSPGSGSAAVEMALRAADLEYRVVRTSEWEPGPALRELQAINPLGQIPTLILPGGTVLTESAAILIHLGLAHPGHGLLPETLDERAVTLRGLVFIAANCYPAVSISDYPARWTTATTQPAQERVRSAARAQLHRSWDIFAGAFGAELARTQADPGALAFLSVVVSRWSGARQHLKAKRADFEHLLLGLEAHPRIAAVLHEHRDA